MKVRKVFTIFILSLILLIGIDLVCTPMLCNQMVSEARVRTRKSRHTKHHRSFSSSSSSRKCTGTKLKPRGRIVGSIPLVLITLFGIIECIHIKRLDKCNKDEK